MIHVYYLVRCIHSNGITVAGTAPDLHRIPFSSLLREPSLFQRVFQYKRSLY